MKTVAAMTTTFESLYRCPTCNAGYWCSGAQLEFRRFIVVCDHCRKAFNPERPDSIKKKWEQEKIDNAPTGDKSIAIATLIGAIQLSREEAIERVNKVFAPGKSVEILIQEALTI